MFFFETKVLSRFQDGFKLLTFGRGRKGGKKGKGLSNSFLCGRNFSSGNGFDGFQLGFFSDVRVVFVGDFGIGAED